MPEAEKEGGLLDSLRRFASTLVEVAHTRLELLATEIDEERARLAETLWLAIGGAFCMGLGVLLAVLLLVVMFWDSHRLLVLGTLAAGFLAGGAALLLTLRRRARRRAGMFAQSLEEL